MTPDFWQTAELFYMNILPLFAILFFIGLISLVFIFTYSRRGSKLRKRLMLGYFASLVVIGGISYFFHQRYEDYLDVRSYITPAVRTQERVFFRQTHEDPAIVDLYRSSISQLEQFRGLVGTVYEEQEARLPLDYEYLGSTGRQHYFLVNEENNYVMRYTGNVELTEEENHFAGASFSLVDEEFAELGFYEPEYNLLDTVYVNREEAEQADNENITWSAVPYHTSTLIDDWVLDHQPRDGTNIDAPG